MSTYMILVHFHSALAVLTGLGFAARGVWRLGMGRAINNRALRIAPHVVDTLLLASGIVLMVQASLWPHLVAWFGLKLVLVVVYIVLGILAFRSRPGVRAWVFFALALLAWIWILGVALGKSSLGWLA